MPGGLGTGQLVDERYALEEPLEEDALGTVWRAHDRGLGRMVCLREVGFPGDLFAAEPTRRQEALRAARTAIRLDHPRAVHLYDAFLDGERLVVVTELVKGTRKLAALVERRGGLARRRVAAIGLDLLDALEAAHAIGLTHGAVDPRVVLVADRAPSRLTGFGLAPAFTDPTSRTWAEAAGTPVCIAPEQWALGGTSPAADLWSLGATLYYAVEGAHAFATPEAAAGDPPRPMARAGDLEPLIDQLLAKDDSERPAGEEIRARLTEVAGVVAGGSAEKARRRRRERRRDPDAPPLELVTDGGDAEPELARDWGAVVASDRSEQEGWVEWPAADEPLDSSDVWLPGAEVSPPPPDAEEAVPEKAPPAEPAEARGEAGGEVRTNGTDPAAATAAPTVLPAAEDEAPRRFRATPSWPPPEGRRKASVVILCSLVIVVMVALLVTNGRFVFGGGGGDTELSAEGRPVLSTDPSSVPGDWITYRHPAVDFGVSYPPGWTVREEGSLVTFREPTGGAQFRVDYTKSTGDDPQEKWLDLERSFSAQHRDDYRRLQLSPASYLGRVAALWEFTYREGDTVVHAVDLGFLTDDHAFALYFQAPAASWGSYLPVFHALLSSVDPPE